MSDKIGNKLKPNKNPKVKVFFAPFFSVLFARFMGQWTKEKVKRDRNQLAAVSSYSRRGEVKRRAHSWKPWTDDQENDDDDD